MARPLGGGLWLARSGACWWMAKLHRKKGGGAAAAGRRHWQTARQKARYPNHAHSARAEAAPDPGQACCEPWSWTANPGRGNPTKPNATWVCNPLHPSATTPSSPSRTPSRDPLPPTIVAGCRCCGTSSLLGNASPAYHSGREQTEPPLGAAAGPFASFVSGHERPMSETTDGRHMDNIQSRQSGSMTDETSLPSFRGHAELFGRAFGCGHLGSSGNAFYAFSPETAEETRFARHLSGRHLPCSCVHPA